MCCIRRCCLRCRYRSRVAPIVIANHAEGTAAPSLSIIVAAYNEESCIAQKIQNFLSCRYSGDAEMIVVSDGSSDRTAEIAESMASERVRVIRQPERRGKGVAVNAGAMAAHGDVLVFTDANSMFAVDALTELVRPLRDKSIGLVTGISRYSDGTIGSAYQRYEQMLKGLESRLGVVAGADGALYAMRRELFKPLDPALINDFVHPILGSLAGCAVGDGARRFCARGIFETAGEFSRQVQDGLAGGAGVFPPAAGARPATALALDPRSDLA